VVRGCSLDGSSGCGDVGLDGRRVVAAGEFLLFGLASADLRNKFKSFFLTNFLTKNSQLCLIKSVFLITLKEKFKDQDRLETIHFVSSKVSS
jgi:hypothetical protein